MDNKKLIKTLINVLPIVIVPLVVERKRIKNIPTYVKLLMLRLKQLQRQRLRFQIKLLM